MKEHKPLLLLAVAGMELSWRYAWATFLTLLILHHPFPLPEAVVSFALAAALTSVYHERGWRVITILGLQAVGFVPVAWRIVHIFNSWSGPFLSRAYRSYGRVFDSGFPIEWVTVLLFLFWAVIFWGGGMRMAKRTRDYSTVCSRFDLGLGTLFLLFLVQFYLVATGMGEVVNPSVQFLLGSFFIFGMLAIGLARNRSGETTDFMPGYRGPGVMLSFILLVLLFGGGLVFFTLPYLTDAARAGYGIMKSASSPLLSLAMKIIMFIFGGEVSVPRSERPPVKKQPQQTTPEFDAPWLRLLGEILMWLVIVLLALLFITIICAMVYSLVRWLFSKTAEGQREQGFWDFLPGWAARLRSLFLSRRRRRVSAYEGAVRLYAVLQVWGRRSGLPRRPCETPAEYGSRLHYQFPTLGDEIGSVVEAFNREFYGEVLLNEQQLASTRFSLSRLCSPSLWFLRLKARIRRPVGQGKSSFP